MTNILIAGILIIPWVILPLNGIADQWRFPKEIAYNILCFVLITYSFYKGLKLNYLNKYLAILIGWIFFTIFMNLYLPFAVSIEQKQLYINAWTLFPSLNVILTIWVSYTALSYFKEEDFKRFAKAFCISSMLMSVFT